MVRLRKPTRKVAVARKKDEENTVGNTKVEEDATSKKKALTKKKAPATKKSPQKKQQEAKEEKEQEEKEQEQEEEEAKQEEEEKEQEEEQEEEDQEHSSGSPGKRKAKAPRNPKALKAVKKTAAAEVEEEEEAAAAASEEEEEAPEKKKEVTKQPKRKQKKATPAKKKKNKRKSGKKRGARSVHPAIKAVLKERDIKNPSNAYFVFVASCRKSQSEDLKDMTFKQVQASLSEKWKAMSPEDKQEYEEQFQKLKAEYDAQLESIKEELGPLPCSSEEDEEEQEEQEEEFSSEQESGTGKKEKSSTAKSPKKRLKFTRSLAITGHLEGATLPDESLPDIAARLGYKLVDEIDEVSHLVVCQQRRTMKVLKAVARGIWVVDYKWLLASLESGVNDKRNPAEIVPVEEDSFEVDWLPGAAKSRAAGGNLLQGMKIGVHLPAESKISPLHVVELIEMAGGKARKSADTTYDIYLEPDAAEPKQVTPRWLFDSIAAYELADASEYKA